MTEAHISTATSMAGVLLMELVQQGYVFGGFLNPVISVTMLARLYGIDTALVHRDTGCFLCFIVSVKYSDCQISGTLCY